MNIQMYLKANAWGKAVKLKIIIAGLLWLVACHASAISDAGLYSLQTKIAEAALLNNELARCPAEIMPKTVLEDEVRESAACDQGIEQCYAECAQDQGYACYYTARALQKNRLYYESEQMFQKSCRLGVASGCTNRAAGMLHLLRDRSAAQTQCITETFNKSCALNDPWGCSMYARQLIEQDDSQATRQKALKVLQKSCLNGQDDPACIDAQRTIAEIKAMH